MRRMKKRGQGSFLSGDIPAIMMIVISIGFFLSSVLMAVEHFNASKGTLNVEAALVDAASAFLKENAKIKKGDLAPDSEFWRLKIDKIETSYAVQTYVELQALDMGTGYYGLQDVPCHPNPCTVGDEPPEESEVLSKRFPISLRGETTDLEVYPALVKVSVYII